MKQSPNHLTCFITGQNLVETVDELATSPVQETPLILRLMPQGEACTLSITAKKQKDALYMLLNKKNILHLMSVTPADLHDSLKDIPLGFFQNIIPQILEMLEKKLHASLGFALKVKKALIGQKAIERKLLQNGDMVGGLVVTKNASTEIAQKLITLGSKNLQIIRDFPDEWLQKITLREKSCYLAFTNDKMNMNFYKEYHLYCALKNL